METIGAYEAKTHFAKLLDRVERGERITITRHGVPVARLMPVATPSLEERQAAVAAIRAMHKPRATTAEILEWIREGRP